jgi:hypothetical protein
MKFLKDNSPIVIVFSSVVLLMLTINLVLDIHPLLNFFNYIEREKYYWTIPSTAIFLICLWLFDRSMRRKIINERTEIFNATIRTIQDLLQNSTSSMQLLIMDMHDKGVHEELIINAEKNIEELKRVINVLASIDPTTIELKELNRNLSIIKMDEELHKRRKA